MREVFGQRTLQGDVPAPMKLWMGDTDRDVLKQRHNSPGTEYRNSGWEGEAGEPAGSR